MRRFSTQRIAGWCDASDAKTASLISRVIADLERQAARCELATSSPDQVANTVWRISDRH